VTKDKKKKKKDKKSGKNGTSSATDTLKALAKNPLVADVVASALMAAASALKDSKRVRALASGAADELGKLSRSGVRDGEALRDAALAIGRRSLEALTADDEKPKKAKPRSAAKKPASRSRKA
jgi:hypothetical protein